MELSEDRGVCNIRFAAELGKPDPFKEAKIAAMQAAGSGWDR
jgi:hypothetical protein